MIEVEHLTKRFGNLTAVDDLSFRVAEGELFAFLGTNGAGKSTTISCMTTLLDYDGGRIALAGHERGKDDEGIRRATGVVFQQSLLDPMLSTNENLAIRSKFYGVAPARIDELSDLVDLGDFRTRPYGVLSGGQKRRVDIARALLHSPRILVLDEPTTGLDPASREQVWNAIALLRRELGLTVLLTTHYMAETENADQVLVVDKGRALAEGTPMDLRARYSRPRLSLVPANPDAARRVQMAAEQHAHSVTFEGGALHLRLTASDTALALLDQLRNDIVDFEFVHGTMDDVFLNLSRQGADAATAAATAPTANQAEVSA
ncbi:MAG: ABC transporter ATP-binding protein [Propionibacteriaceae bacterium]|nr:ABC transporter ATP-binding protein [Propionibacteriaceae bacterium]